jgi:hypothetical protein
VTGAHTLRIEAARAGVSVSEYTTRVGQGLLWCYRCLDWHQAEAFPADARRHTGRAGSCQRAIRAAARDALASRGQFPPPTAAVWVVRRPGPAPGRPGGQAWAYWHGPGHEGAGTWSPVLDDGVAQFAAASQARNALIAASGGPDAVPPGCRLVRVS